MIFLIWWCLMPMLCLKCQKLPRRCKSIKKHQPVDLSLSTSVQTGVFPITRWIWYLYDDFPHQNRFCELQSWLEAWRRERRLWGLRAHRSRHQHIGPRFHHSLGSLAGCWFRCSRYQSTLWRLLSRQMCRRHHYVPFLAFASRTWY